MGRGVGRSVVSPLLRPSGAGIWGGTARTKLPPSTSRPWVGTVSPLLRSSMGSALARATPGRGAPPGATPAPPVAGSGPVAQRRAPAPWQIFGGLTVLVGIVLALSFLVGSPPPAPTPPTFTQTEVLAYHARTPPSAIYPSGRIVTGNPVFLKLVDRLGISYFYSTDAPPSRVRGTVRLAAIVSGENGWQISLPLVTTTPLKAGHLELVATLDLARIQAIATQVSESTGTYTGTLTVSVTAVSKIRFDGAKPVAATVELPLTLSAVRAHHVLWQRHPDGSRPCQNRHKPAQQGAPSPPTLLAAARDQARVDRRTPAAHRGNGSGHPVIGERGTP